MSKFNTFYNCNKSLFIKITTIKFYCFSGDKDFQGLENSGKCRTQYSHRPDYIDKPFRCSVCGKTYTQKWILKRHFVQHTKENQMFCPVCFKSFTRKDLYRKHFDRHKQCDD